MRFIYSYFISSAVIVIFPNHRYFLAFAWHLGTWIFRYFLLCALSFGLLSASLKLLQKSRRSQGIPIAIFLDYGLAIGGGAYRVQARIYSLWTVHADLLKSRFVRIPKEEKSLWEPVQIFSWLRVHLGITLSMEVLEPRMNALLNCLTTWRLCLHISLASSTVHFLRVPCVSGQIISLSSRTGSVACIMARFLFSVVNSAVSWDS